MRGVVVDKILVDLQGRPVLDFSISAFEPLDHISAYMVVYRDEPQRTQIESRIGNLTEKTVLWVQGGEERQDSVLNALEAIPEGTEFVMIHDCARPLVRTEVLKQVQEAAFKDKAACLAHRVVDTIKQVSANTSSLHQLKLTDLDRNRLWSMETPQAFGFKLIHGAYKKLKSDKIQVTDDTAAVAHYDYGVTLVENPYPNPKITRPEDLVLAELMLQQWDEDA